MTADEVEHYVERKFQTSGRTTFPTVRQVAHALGTCNAAVMEVVDGHDNLMLTYWNVDYRVYDGWRFVETVSEPLGKGAQDVRKFMSKAHPEPDTGCWLWSDALHASGYGRIRVDGVLLWAHRCSYEAFNGPIPPGGQVLHLCDNPPCVNPQHLVIGDHALNMHHMAVRGRACSVLTAGDVLEIRECQDTQARMGVRFGVSPSTIGRIKRGETWRHLAK